MDENFKGVVKVDFKDAREKNNFAKGDVEQIFRAVGYNDIDLDAVEREETPITETEVDTLMGVYGIPDYLRKDYYAKYAPKREY